jgi:ketosteroid isomerase-like protein
MSQENVKVVRQQFEAILDAMNARDFDSLAEILPREVEFGSVLAVAEGERAFTGIDGLRKWAEQVDAVWDDWRQEVVDFRAVSDNQAVAVTRATGRARASGVPLDTRTGNVLTWGHGKGWRIRAYRDPHEAFEAVGLRE